MKNLFGILLAMLPTVLSAQQNIEVEKRQVKASWITNPAEFLDDFQLTLTHLEAPFPGGDEARTLIDKRKKESANLFPRTSTVYENKNERDVSDSLIQLENFPVRFFLNDVPLLGGTPNDNTLAISNSGKLLTSFNTQIWGYDVENDTFMFRDNAKHPSFNQFLNGYSNGSYSLYFPFDPKLLYHPGLDRFILIFLTGRDPSNSGVVVSFSSTGNPSDVWYSYLLSGNPLNDNTWTDYPQIAMNEHSLYLSLNQLYPDSSWITGFSQTVIWQMDLAEGFGGASTLNTKLWSGANFNGSKLRYLRPVKNGLGPIGNDMYFVANRPFDVQNDTVFLVKIEGDVTDNNENIQVTALKSNVAYGLPPDAIQPNNHLFLTNDARALGAVRMQNEIQFVGNTVDAVSGKCAIYHGIIEDVTNPSLYANIINHPSRDLGYPNIDFVGKYAEGRDVLIFFNHTSATEPSGNSAVFFNQNRAYGPIKTLKTGETYVDIITGNDERWGDYSGIQRKFNEDNKAWVAGYFSYGTQRPGIWVSEISTPNTLPMAIMEKNKTALVKSFPNPTKDFITIQFNLEKKQTIRVELCDATGKLVRVLAADEVKDGNNQLRMSLLPLTSGLYYVNIMADSGLVISQKIIKE